MQLTTLIPSNMPWFEGLTYDNKKNILSYVAGRGGPGTDVYSWAKADIGNTSKIVQVYHNTNGYVLV